MTYLSLGLRIALTLAFVAAGGAKLAGVEAMVATFETIGLGQWFRGLTGVIEIAAAALLWVRGFTVVGAALLVSTMISAVLAHLVVLGPSAAPAAALGVLSAAVAYLHRGEAAALVSRNSN
ncbi:MAG: DoxX family protein [Pseudomonadota bacterium]